MVDPLTEQRVELAIRAESAEMRRASSWLRNLALSQGVPEDCIVRLDHCMDEALANVIAHGGPRAREADILIVLQLGIEAGRNTAVLGITDAGIAFDPTRAAVAPRPGSLAEARPGGLGIPMMRSYAERIGYTRAGERNHLTFMVTW